MVCSEVNGVHNTKSQNKYWQQITTTKSPEQGTSLSWK